MSSPCADTEIVEPALETAVLVDLPHPFPLAKACAVRIIWALGRERGRELDERLICSLQ
jgi:hypothetical protein